MARPTIRAFFARPSHALRSLPTAFPDPRPHRASSRLPAATIDTHSPPCAQEFTQDLRAPPRCLVFLSYPRQHCAAKPGWASGMMDYSSYLPARLPPISRYIDASLSALSHRSPRPRNTQPPHQPRRPHFSSIISSTQDTPSTPLQDWQAFSSAGVNPMRTTTTGNLAALVSLLAAHLPLNSHHTTCSSPPRNGSVPQPAVESMGFACDTCGAIFGHSRPIKTSASVPGGRNNTENASPDHSYLLVQGLSTCNGRANR